MSSVNLKLEIAPDAPSQSKISTIPESYSAAFSAQLIIDFVSPDGSTKSTCSAKVWREKSDPHIECYDSFIKIQNPGELADDMPEFCTHANIEVASGDDTAIRILNPNSFALWLTAYDIKFLGKGNATLTIKMGVGRQFLTGYPNLPKNISAPVQCTVTQSFDGATHEIEKFNLELHLPWPMHPNRELAFFLTTSNDSHGENPVLPASLPLRHVRPAGTTNTTNVLEADLNVIKGASGSAFANALLHHSSPTLQLGLDVEQPRNAKSNKLNSLGRKYGVTSYNITISSHDRQNNDAVVRVSGNGSYKWFVLPHGQNVTVSQKQYVEGNEAYAKKCAEEVNFEATMLLSGAPRQTFDRSNNIALSGNVFTIPHHFEIPSPDGTASLSFSLEFRVEFNVRYSRRLALDMGAGSHLMGSYPEAKLINVSDANPRSYTRQEETTAHLYYTAQVGRDAGMTALPQDFPLAVLRRRFPDGVNAMSKLTCLLGNDDVRQTDSKQRHSHALITDFKAGLFRGKPTFECFGGKENSIDVFAEICRVRFMEAILHLEVGEAGLNLHPDPLTSPPQLIVTHPAYVNTNTFTALCNALSEVQKVLGCGPESDEEKFISSVCTIPEPVALLCYLEEHVKGIVSLSHVGVLDFGYRTVDVALRGKNRMWLHASAADLGGSILDVALAKSVYSYIVQKLARQESARSNILDGLNEAFAFDTATLKEAQTELQSHENMRRLSLLETLERVESAKIALHEQMDKKPHEQATFTIQLAQKSDYDDPKSDWLKPALVMELIALGFPVQDNADGKWALSVPWDEMVSQPPFQEYLAQMDAYLSGIPFPEKTTLIITGRAARFLPLRRWLGNRRYFTDHTLKFEDSLELKDPDHNPQATLDPKPMVALGALLMAQKLAEYNTEINRQACILFKNGNKIVGYHPIESLKEAFVFDRPFDSFFVARCSQTVATYLQDHPADLDSIDRFMLTEPFSSAIKVNEQDGCKGHFEVKEEVLVSGQSTRKDSISLWMENAEGLSLLSTGPAEVETGFKLSLARFGAVQSTAAS
jgi:hypothetical protein